MKVLGICFDVWISSAALIDDGKVIAAAPEERLNRQKLYRGFPKKAIEFCMKTANCKISDVDFIAVAWNPGRHIKRYNPRFSQNPRWRAEHLYAIPNNLAGAFDENSIGSIEQTLMLKNGKCSIIYLDHHLSHAANGLYLSPFSEAAIFSADGRGEEDTAFYGFGKGSKITCISSIKFPHSIGLFYGAFTEFLGFRPDSDEWKVMALASYSSPDNHYYEKVNRLVRFIPNGQIELDLSYFSFFLQDQLHTYSEKFTDEFGEPRKENAKLEQKHYHLAAAVQKVVEEVLVKCLNHLHKLTGLDNLVVNGGVFMNSVFNGKILSQSKFKSLFISSCPDDSGTSIGAALYLFNSRKNGARKIEVQSHNYYGPEFTNEEIKQTLAKYKIKGNYINDVEKFTAGELSGGKIIGWFQGRMEFGQRALGNRSILCDPRDASMKERLNVAVKYRESFRPFAPSILEEETEKYFDIDKKVLVPFMEKVYMIKKDKQKIIPAVTHVDGSGRLQTVGKGTNSRYYKLISEFRKLTGVPVLLNTSFNLNGEPIVCSPTDAIRTFFSSGLDILVLGNYVIQK